MSTPGSNRGGFGATMTRIIRARWLVTTLAIVSACAGVAALVLRVASPESFRTVTTDVTDLRLAAFVFGVVALGGSMDRTTPGPGIGPPTGWQRGTALLSLIGIVLGALLLVIGLIGWLSGRA
ncbi:hypothetical protein [Ruania halotolerans]|uniref:hypothetical protein n=1 Tax=Ruania halotolerans TaxID=2897773 RepID=UPI001E5AFBAB|nr:hypothetical protein [Ruania halotolerans]UFU08171.1 hypothetical protein LQF10_08790 [Ruania halotolerans]